MRPCERRRLRYCSVAIKSPISCVRVSRLELSIQGDSIGYRHDRSNWQAFCPRDGNVWSSFCDCSRLDVPNGHDVLGLTCVSRPVI